MFSLFKDGITDTSYSRHIDLPALVKMIRENPLREKIETIRSLRRNNDDYYKKLKSELPNITPVCMVKERNLKNDFDKNFIQFSQFLYFDFDKSNASEFKEYFINRYGKIVSVVCLSSSGGGISVLVKVKNTITRDNFSEVLKNVKDTFFKDETNDPLCKDIGRVMFISYDPDVFFNYENEVELTLPFETLQPDKSKKREPQCINLRDLNNTLEFPGKLIQIEEILRVLVTKTVVAVVNPVVDYKSVEIVKFFIPRIIHDGEKHSTYSRMIQTLIYINPEVDRDVIYSYLWYINNRFARPKMEIREFVRFFNLIYTRAKESGNIFVNKKTVWIHFNQSCGLNINEKKKLASIINGVKSKNESIQSIIEAKISLQRDGIPITCKEIREITGLSIKTVRKYFNSEPEDMENLIEALNTTFARAA
jgi:hypothetical protein